MSPPPSKPETAFVVPEISQAEISAFHQVHFGGDAVENFATQFFNKDASCEAQAPIVEEDVADGWGQEDDGLGYYEDGVKRTLTDEQIAMFRHSELEALRKAQEKARESHDASRSSSSMPMDLDDSERDEGELSAGELPTPQPAVQERKKKKKKKKRGSGKTGRRQEPKIDLRKRTWDVVETGLESLDYGEMEPVQATSEPAVQRRRITYDDD